MWLTAPWLRLSTTASAAITTNHYLMATSGNLIRVGPPHQAPLLPTPDTFSKRKADKGQKALIIVLAMLIKVNASLPDLDRRYVVFRRDLSFFSASDRSHSKNLSPRPLILTRP
jgi:hypothetical protein